MTLPTATAATARAAIEAVDIRIAGWDISLADTTADNASSAMFVVSEEGVPLGEVVPANVHMTLTVNGRWSRPAAATRALGDSLNVLNWLAQTAGQHSVTCCVPGGDHSQAAPWGPAFPLCRATRPRRDEQPRRG